MKNLIVLLTIVLLTSCANRTDQAGKFSDHLPGEYSVTAELKDPENAAAMALFDLEMRMTFEEGGEAAFIGKIGSMQNTEPMTWEIRGDSIYLVRTVDGSGDTYAIKRTREGWEFSNSDEIRYLKKE